MMESTVMRKKMDSVIPGHFKASTLFLIITAFLTAYLDKEFSLVSYENRGLGLVLILIGAFCADQAMHLNQHKDHQEELPPTAIERLMQSNKWSAVMLGEIILILGAFIL